MNQEAGFFFFFWFCLVQLGKDNEKEMLSEPWPWLLCARCLQHKGKSGQGSGLGNK